MDVLKIEREERALRRVGGKREWRRSVFQEEESLFARDTAAILRQCASAEQNEILDHQPL